MIYLLCFALSSLFAALANRAQRRWKVILFSAISILLPVLLAGFRDFSIGIDVENYLYKDYYWVGVRTRDFWDYLRYYHSLGRGEYVFVFLLAILGKLTANFRVFLFLSHTVIITTMYVGAWRQRKSADPALIMMLFYLFFFNHSLNIIRQYMAMAMIFAAFKNVTERKYLRFCLVVLAAYTIHSASVLALSIPLIHFFLYGNTAEGCYRLGKRSWMSYKRFPLRVRKLLLSLGLAMVVIMLVPVCRLLLSLELISRKYNFYLDNAQINYSGIVTLMLLVEMAVVLLMRKHLKARCAHYDFYTTLSAVYLILLQLSAMIYSGRRIALFFALPNLVTLAYLAEAAPAYLGKYIHLRPAALNRLAKCVILAAGLVYWTYFYVLKNASQTFPYLSVFSG